MSIRKMRFATVLAGALAGFLVFLAGVLAGFLAFLAGTLAGFLLEKSLPKSSRALAFQVSTKLEFV